MEAMGTQEETAVVGVAMVAAALAGEAKEEEAPEVGA